MNDEEVQALKTTAKYEFYKVYVEPLEKDYDELKEKYKKLQLKHRTLKKKYNEYVPHDNTDCDRYRNQAILLKKKNNNLLNLLDRRNEEIEELKKKLERLK